MKITNKLDSIQKINELKLNRFPEELFSNSEEQKVRKFLEKYPAKYYAIRSKEIVGCKNNNFKVLKEEIFSEMKKFNLFSINVSSYNYTSNLILIGDIKIGSNNEVWFIGSTNPNFTGKMAEKHPDFNYSTDIFDKRLNLIPSFDQIYKYIAEYNLIDVIVEFAIYNRPVGINNEPIIVFEIRTDF